MKRKSGIDIRLQGITKQGGRGHVGGLLENPDRLECSREGTVKLHARFPITIDEHFLSKEHERILRL